MNEYRITDISITTEEKEKERTKILMNKSAEKKRAEKIGRK